MKKLFKSMFLLTMVAATSFALTACNGGFKKVQRKELKTSLKDVRKSRGYKSDLASTGNVKALVIPVEFVDYPCSSTKLAKYGGCEGIRDDIRRTMFGKSEETNWESLSSFYRKSSYGKLNLTGKVTDWFRPTLSAAQLAMPMLDNPSDNTGVSDSILDQAIEWYRKTYDDIDDFDIDKDGYIDAVYLIYTVPSKTQIGKIDTSELFWAYTYWSNAHSDINVDVDEVPVPYTYFWASIDFMYEDKMLNDEGEYVECKDENGDWLPDAHTFIHESGHIMGLPDYYSYGYNADYGPLGGIDMMDNNVGDHNAYSKMLYGWTEPYYVTDSTTITIKPFYSSGDFILLNADWNGSMYDEYILLEYYVPKGLNKYDADKKFAGAYPQVFQEPGVKVYHVDSRLGGFDIPSSNVLTERGRFIEYVEDVMNRYGYCDVASDNTSDRSAFPEFKLIELLEPSGECTFDDRDEHGALVTPYATDESLFHVGDSFGYEGKAFENFRFNSGRTIVENDAGGLRILPVEEGGAAGDEVGFRFLIEKMDANGVTIKIEKTANN